MELKRAKRLGLSLGDVHDCTEKLRRCCL
jgi:hypothetical protein